MKICFIGGARYSRPLDETSARKFEALQSLGELHVIGFKHHVGQVANLRAGFQPVLPELSEMPDDINRSSGPQLEAQPAFHLIPQLPLPVLRYAAMLLLGTILTAWLLLRHKVQVCVAQSPYEALGPALVKRIASRLGVQMILVVESHGSFSEDLFQQRSIWFPRLFRILMERTASFTLAEADLLRAVSNATRIQLQEYAPGKPAIQFPAWSDLGVFFAAGENRRPPAVQTIIFAGALIPRKGIHHLIDAFAALAGVFPSARLIVIGSPFNRTYAGRLKKQVMRHNLGSRVTFPGALRPRDLGACMAAASVFVVPSLSEGLGRVVFEAMSTGTPVLASEVGGIPDMIEDGVNGLLSPPGDPHRLCERLRWILDHPAEAFALGQRGRVSASQVFSREKYVAGYAAIFQAAGRLLAPVESTHASAAL